MQKSTKKPCSHFTSFNVSVLQKLLSDGMEV